MREQNGRANRGPGASGRSWPARRGIRISDLRGPHGEMYIAAVDSLGHVRVEVHVHDPADEELVIRLLEMYLAAVEPPAWKRAQDAREGRRGNAGGRAHLRLLNGRAGPCVRPVRTARPAGTAAAAPQAWGFCRFCQGRFGRVAPRASLRENRAGQVGRVASGPPGRGSGGRPQALLDVLLVVADTALDVRYHHRPGRGALRLLLLLADVDVNVQSCPRRRVSRVVQGPVAS